MSNCCNCDSEINRDGSGQLGRYLKALDPAYAPIDDRSIEDLLVFTRRYANQVRFYDIPGGNSEEEEYPSKISWSEFFRRDMAVIAASIAVIDLDQLKKDYDEIRTALDAKPGHHLFSNLFDPILGIAVRIGKWVSLVIPENPLYDDLLLAIHSNLKIQMQKIVAYEEGFKYVDSQHPLNLDYSAIQDKTLWGLNENINADISIYEGTETADRLRHASLYVDDIFNSFYGFLKELVERSESYMQYALEQYPAHQPHMALFISFLQLFRLAQEQMNGLTERMLDFYYRDVLQLTGKPSIPDKAYIVFELAKDVTEFDIAPGTTLKAQPDASGKDQVYATETDLVVNQAKVKELKTIFIEKAASAALTTNKLINTIYARPVAKSLDGFGAKFTDPNPKWPTFGKGRIPISIDQSACKQIGRLAEAGRIDQAEIGFAIASPQLVMQGGKRMLEIVVPKDLISALNQSSAKLRIWLTGEKDWVLIDTAMDPDLYNKLMLYINKGIGIFNPDVNPEKSYIILPESIVIYLPISEKGIIPFDSSIHTGYDFKTTWPVIRVGITSDLGIDESRFTSLKLTSLRLTARVGSINPSLDIIKADENKDIPSNIYDYHLDGLRTLVLQNDLGPLPPDQPFDPFTPYPALNRSFYIGSDEVFNKNLGQLAINLKKVSGTNENPDDYIKNDGDAGTVFNVSELENSEWTTLARERSARTFTQWSLTQNIQNIFVLNPDSVEGGGFLQPWPTHRVPLEHIEKFSGASDKGFIRLDNLLPVSPGDNESILQASQEMAPELQIKEVSVSYYSELQGLDPSIDQFFHLYPFGVVETFTNLNRISQNIPANVIDFKTLDKQRDFLLVDAKNLLLPQFNFLSPYAKYNQGQTKSGQNTFQKVHDLLSGPGNADTDLIKSILDSRGSTAARLMLDASGLIEKNTGGDNQYSTGLPEEGMLFIGLENLQPLQSVSMLFQFAEGSAENEDDDPPKINWSYLTNNEWRPFKAENIVSDGTYGFQTTGIIKIDTPEDASSHNTIITDGLIWFCASISENSNRIPQLIDIVTQATEARFQDNNNDQSHFDKALQAGSISQLVTPVSQVASAHQPFASFDGKHKEIGKEFYTRVSERLRHKGRAINAWDYEHLVLDRFPGIYKVKCITHTDPNCNCRTAVTKPALALAQTVLPTSVIYDLDNVNGAAITAVLNSVSIDLQNNPSTHITLVAYGDKALEKIKKLFSFLTGNIVPEFGPTTVPNPVEPSKINWRTIPEGNIINNKVDIIKTVSCCGPQIAPGHVLVVPVSNFKNRNAANPLQPKTGRRTLLAIQDYLSGLTSPFVHVHAKNPEYDEIIVSFRVKFYSGIDKGYFMKKLNDEIVQFLTPWAFDENADVQFDQKIYASSVINFIEERSYVDFITDFVMGVCCDTCCPDVFTGAFGTVTGKITNEKGQAVEGVLVKIKDLNLGTTSAADGTYSFDGVPNGEHILVAYFSLFSTAKETFTMPDVRGSAVVVDLTHSNQTLSTGCGCEDIEYLLQYDENFDGDIVAKPCSLRSILVSVPRHIIIPYEDPDPVSPCDDRLARLAVNSSIIAVKTNLPKDLPVLKKRVDSPAVIAKPKAVLKEKKIVKPVKKTVPVKHARKKNG